MVDETESTPTDAAAHPFAVALEQAHDAIAPKMRAHKRGHLTDVLHQLEADLRPIIGPVVSQVMDNPGLSDELRALLGEAADPAHQFGSLVVGFAIGSVVGPVLGAALDPEINVIRQNSWANKPQRALPPDLAATAVLKGVLEQGTAAGEAEFAGYDAARFGQMVEAAGQSIGIAEALLLYRRDQITLGHLQDIVKYSNVNPKFYDDVPKLQYGPPPAGEVVAGLLKGHLTPDEAQTKLGHAGIDPAELPWMRATAGRPPSPAEMVRLWHRGAATQTDVEAAVRQSDINDDFLPFVLELGHWYPPPRSIMAMARDGSIDDARTRQLFTFAGVPVDIQDDMIAEAHHSKGTTVKQLTTANIVGMYSERLITKAEANAKLVSIRYTADDATLLLDYADDVRKVKAANAVASMVGTKYRAHRMTKNDAVHILTTAGVANAAQTDLFALWDLERDANVVLPTPSMVVGAYRRQDITAAECKQRLLAAGVQSADLGIFVADGWPPTKPADAKAAAQAVINA